MTFFQAFVLGLIQGLTEFLPISSSGHLVLVPWALGWPSAGLAFDTMAHWGTLLAVLTYFRRDWVRIGRGFARSLIGHGPRNPSATNPLADPDSRLAWWIIIGTIPAAVLGLVLKDFVEGLFSSPTAAAALLLVTALFLFLSERVSRRRRQIGDLGWADAFLVGLAQAAALAPGISRSGATIGTGMLRGLDREAAARFSFLLATPAIVGAGLLQLWDLIRAGGLSGQLGLLGTGFLVAAISGYLCIKFLLSFLRTGRLYVFAAYCGVIGLGVLTAIALA